ncbi:MAG: EF-hand domain-containing protein, partial [Pseudoalteromonas nigrifaciens]
FDRNQNGLLSRAETASDPALWSRFASYDKDKDGHLSLSEFTLYASQ